MKEQGRKKTIAAALTMLLAALTFSFGFSFARPLPQKAHAESAKTTLTAQLDLTSVESADKLATEGYAWNKDSKTMTMDGFTLDTADRQALLLPADTVIVLQAGSVNSVKSGDTTAHIQKDNYVVHCAGNLTVQGSGKLTLQTGNPLHGNNELSCMVAQGDLTIGGSADISALFGGDLSQGAKYIFVGASCQSFIMQDNAKLTVIKHTSAESSDRVFTGVESEKDMFFRGNASFTCALTEVATHALTSKQDITVADSANLDIECNNTSAAVACYGDFTMTGGSMKVVANSVAISSLSSCLVAIGNASFLAGEAVLTYNAPDAATVYAVFSQGGFSNKDALVYAKSADGYTGFASETVFSSPEIGNLYSYFASGKPIRDLKITGFVHTVSPDWSSNASGHWHAADCGKTEHREAFASHTPGGAATCTSAQTCTVCGYQVAPAIAHNFVNGACSVCGIKDPNASVSSANPWWLWLVIGVAAALVLYLIGFALYKMQILKGKLADVLYGWLNKLFTRKKPE